MSQQSEQLLVRNEDRKMLTLQYLLQKEVMGTTELQIDTNKTFGELMLEACLRIGFKYVSDKMQLRAEGIERSILREETLSARMELLNRSLQLTIAQEDMEQYF